MHFVHISISGLEQIMILNRQARFNQLLKSEANGGPVVQWSSGPAPAFAEK